MIELFSNPWVNIGVTVLVALVITKVLAFILINILKKITSFTKSTKDDELLQKLENPLTYLVGLLVLFYFIPATSLSAEHILLANNIVFSLIILFIARIISTILALVVNLWGEAFAKKTHSLLNPQLILLFTRSISIIIYGVAAVYILTVWNIEILPIIGSLGIAGLAIAFALQETLKNFFGGIQLILDRNIAKGDIVELSNGTSGLIHDISLRSTRLKTWDNRMVIVPNGVLANDIVTNITQPDRSRRVTVVFGVEYGSDPDYVKHICMEEIKSVENVVLDEPAPRILFKSMDDSALTFEALYWVEDLSHFISAREDGTTKIYERLNKEGIGIPFPQTTVWFNDESKIKSKPYKKKAIPKAKKAVKKKTSKKK